MFSEKRALLSVSDKSGIVKLGRKLQQLGWEIISTGGTARTLGENGVAVTEAAAVTGFPEILGGRVKTLHPRIHGGLLARLELEEHRRQLAEQGILPIQLLVVNLYPFAETVAQPGVTLADAVENIDIGGPAMIRAAAKNCAHVAVVVNPDRYASIIRELSSGNTVSAETRFKLAAEAFAHTVRCYYRSLPVSAPGSRRRAFPRAPQPAATEDPGTAIRRKSTATGFFLCPGCEAERACRHAAAAGKRAVL